MDENTEKDPSNPLFEKDLFGDPAADNGIGGDSLMDDLSFSGDGGLDPPFQEQLENFLESTGVEESIDPPLADVSGEESNASTIVSQTKEEPMQTEAPSATNDEEKTAVVETNEDADGKTKSDEKEAAEEVMETGDMENKASEDKTPSEEKVEEGKKDENVEEIETEEVERVVTRRGRGRGRVAATRKGRGKANKTKKVAEKVVKKDEEKVDEKMEEEEKVDETKKEEEKAEGKKEEKVDEKVEEEEKAEGKKEEKVDEKVEEKVDDTKKEAEQVDVKKEEKIEAEIKEGESGDCEMKDDSKPTDAKEEEKNDKVEKKATEKSDKDSVKQDDKKAADEEKAKQDDKKAEKKAADEEKAKKDAKKAKNLKEQNQHWAAVNKNPTDFTSWSYLLHYVETEGNITSARKAFTEFFSRYPYCYGYWKKFADLEKKIGNFAEAKEIFENGLRAIPLSVELWIHFVNFTMHITKDEEDRVETIRNLFEQAIEAAGTDFKSDKLWDMYIKFEKEQKDAKRLTNIYDRLIRIPTQLYSHHFEKFKRHLNSHPIKEVLSDDEYDKLRLGFLDEIDAELEAAVKEDDNSGVIADGDVPPPGFDDGPPGMNDDPPGMSDAPPGEKPKKSTAASFIKEMKNETDWIKEKMISNRNTVHQETEQEVSKRWAFEEAIKRPYFHVKPLEKPQLKNWIEYLDFEIAEGMLERVVILFERCLIACALYEDLWLKYAKFMEPHSTEAVRSVYTRACTIHLPTKLNIVSHWAAFEETQGNHEKAREILVDLEKRHPKSTLAIMRQINLERRIKCHDKAVAIFKKVLEDSKKSTFNFFSCKLARYYYKILGEFDKAKEVLNTALEKDLDNPSLYLQLLDLEYQRTPPNEKSVLQLFQRVQKSGLDSETKTLFSQRRVEFLLDFGQDVNQLLQVITENQKMWKSQQLALAKKKRLLALESTTEGEVAPPEKKAKTEAKASGDSTAVAAATTTAPATAAAATKTSPAPQYQPPPIQPNRPPPPQHIMPPYGQQPGYNYAAWNQYNQAQHGSYNYPQWGGYNQGYY